MHTPDSLHFAQRLGTVIDAHFAGRPGILESVAGGAGFEQWFALESRLAIEARRDELGLGERVKFDGSTVLRHWTANEYHKIDLYIGDFRGGDDSDDRCYCAIEFKLIHNNKNWPKQCFEVLADLQPSKGKKSQAPTLARYAIPVLIGKQYSVKNGYPVSKHETLADWLSEVDSALACETRELWRSPVRPVTGEYILPGSHLEFRILELAS